MKYIDGFVIVVPKNKLKDYKKMAAKAGKIWKKHGALEFFESVGDDLNSKCSSIKFKNAAKAKKDEKVLFSFIVYKSKQHRDKVNAKVMKDPLMNECEGKEMPFDMKRMMFGGFKVIVEY